MANALCLTREKSPFACYFISSHTIHGVFFKTLGRARLVNLDSANEAKKEKERGKQSSQPKGTTPKHRSFIVHFLMAATAMPEF